jgi:hypothetical protein
MLSNRLRTDALNYAELEQEVKDGSMAAQRILEALDSTLVHFNIQQDKEMAANTLLMFAKLDSSKWDMNDPKLQIINNMLKHLESLLE